MMLGWITVWRTIFAYGDSLGNATWRVEVSLVAVNWLEKVIFQIRSPTGTASACMASWRTLMTISALIVIARINKSVYLLLSRVSVACVIARNQCPVWPVQFDVDLA